MVNGWQPEMKLVMIHRLARILFHSSVLLPSRIQRGELFDFELFGCSIFSDGAKDYIDVTANAQ